MLKPRCTDEHHRALQHAERKARTYRKAVLGLAGLLLLSLSGNLASTALTILVFKESRWSADAIPQRPVVLSDSKAAVAPVGTSLPTSVKTLPTPLQSRCSGRKRCAVAPSGAEACWELAKPAVMAIPDAGLQGNIATDRIVPTEWLPVLLAGASYVFETKDDLQTAVQDYDTNAASATAPRTPPARMFDEGARGHCAVDRQNRLHHHPPPLGAPGDCGVDAAGTWSAATLAVVDRDALGAACMLQCAHCARCNYLTVSEHYGDCDWHAVCDTRALVPSRHHRTHARLPLEALTTPTISTARPRGRGACAAAQQWVVVLSTGRAGSTTILQMLNAAAPLVALSGEQTDWGARPGDRSSLLNTLWGALELSLRIAGRRDAARAAQPDPNALKDTACQGLLAQFPPSTNSTIRGFKDLIANVDVGRVVSLLPGVRFVINYREDQRAQTRSGFWRTAGNASVSALRQRTDQLLRETAASPRFDLPLERFSVRAFDALLRFLGVRGCGYRRVLQANAAQRANASRDARPLMWGTCKFAHGRP